eukprot:s35_g51.t1
MVFVLSTSRLPAQLAQLATHQPRLIAGCDISPEAIAQQKAVAPPRSPGTRLIFSVGDVRRLPYPDLCFDLVLEKGLFDAVGSTRRGTLQLPTMLAEVWRVVAPGGALISMSQPGQAEMKSSSRSWLQQIQEADLQPAPVSVKEDFRRKVAAAHKEADDRCDALQKGLVNKLHLTQRAMEKAFWDSFHGDVDEAQEVPTWQPLALHWASMSKASSESQAFEVDVDIDTVIYRLYRDITETVPVYTTPEEALKCLPDRFLAFQKASWPSAPSEKCAALAAIANIITDLGQNDLVFFLRSLELTLRERRHNEEGTEEARPPLRPKPLFPAAKQPPPPRVLPKPPPPPPPTPPSVPPRPVEPAPSSPTAATAATAAPAPAAPAPPAPASPSSSETETAEEKAAKAAAAAAQKKADAAALDIVYDLCQAQKEKPCHADGSLQAENFRNFIKEVFAAATQPSHWEEAWRRTAFPEELRAEASQAFLQNLLDFAMSEVPQVKDPDTTSEHRVRSSSDSCRARDRCVVSLLLHQETGCGGAMSQVNAKSFGKWSFDIGPPESEVFGQESCGLITLEWLIMRSWLLFHWFPQTKTAGWGWSRVGWSWSGWWKVVERLLNQAQKNFPEAAFKMLKEALVRMQEQKGCKHMFLKPPFDDLRRQMLIEKLSSLAPEMDVSTEAKAKEALAPLKFWQSR